ncbi:divergent polysaccharide deacetylase family protein [Sulfuricurvum sp.]|uniref:divergent polysaccharide deacetylase family protein n=1 Tax=Sulfuricurvum sp. TaxID=2025608 RepID=UPI003BB58B19
MSKRPRPNYIFSLQYLAWILVGIILLLLTFLIGYLIGFNQVEEKLEAEQAQTKKLTKQIQQMDEQDDNLVLRPKATTENIEINRLKKELQIFIEKEQSHKVIKTREDISYQDQKKVEKNLKKAKLVIIIDDVSYLQDVQAIQSTGLPLVMSFLPPSPRHPESAKLAQKQSHYMVHLPLEALDFKDEEIGTLRVNDSITRIEERILELKQLYPAARYLNNHTGSKFTANSDAMERLIGVMKKEGLLFVDSRTSAETKVPQISTKLHVRYLGRDVFLDHQDGISNVKKQIRKAIAKAKCDGKAIAIGHPRPDTIRALKESKELLKEVQLVGIDKI